ncbi:MAG: MarR family winged helix-turn-helix transcriptional regulator [Rhodoglobus sp.]
MSEDDQPHLHYRSVVVERVTTLMHIWQSPRFQSDIIPEPWRRLGAMEVRVLWHLGSVGSATASEIGAETAAGAPTVSKAVAKLVAAGLISKQQSSSDRRSHSLRLTPEGRVAAQKVYDVGDAMVTEIFGSWPEADVAKLSELLDRFTDAAASYATQLRRSRS